MKFKIQHRYDIQKLYLWQQQIIFFYVFYLNPRDITGLTYFLASISPFKSTYFGNSILYYYAFYLFNYILSLSLHSFNLWTIYSWKFQMRATFVIPFIGSYVVSTSILTVWHVHVCDSKETHENQSWPKRICFWFIQNVM